MATDDGTTVAAARARYFEDNGFPADGGYGARWVRLAVGPLALRLPNTKSRVRSVRLHDVHHVLTGYATTWTGEAEIGAWELASGCRDHWAAWGLNAAAVTVGLVIAPRAVAAAFRRGRGCRNLYAREWSEDLLDERVGDLRVRLGIAP